MANEKINAPRVSLLQFVNEHPALKSGRVELIGAFVHYMEQVKKITQDTETNFALYLEEFKNKRV